MSKCFKLKSGNKNQYIILAVFLIFLVVGGEATFNVLFSSMSYSTGYQGAKASFKGAVYDSIEYTNTERGDASRCQFDTTLALDVDNAQSDLPNIMGEMTSVFIPSETLSNTPTWIPSEWTRSISYIQNPTRVWDWTIQNKSYVMEEWLLRWYISLSAEWDALPLFSFEMSETRDQRYKGLEIWFEIDLTPVWYFEDAETSYFAVAKLQVADVRKDGHDNSGELVPARNDMSVRPESQGSILTLYNGLFAKDNPVTKEPNIYQGQVLNPSLFTDKVYSYISLENFGTTYTVEVPAGQVRRGDVITFAFDVRVFVVGQWDVQDIQSIEDIEGEEGYGRTAKVGSSGFSLPAWLSNPSNRLLVAILGIVGLFVFLAIVAPWVLVAIFSLLGSKRRGR